MSSANGGGRTCRACLSACPPDATLCEACGAALPAAAAAPAARPASGTRLLLSGALGVTLLAAGIAIGLRVAQPDATSPRVQTQPAAATQRAPALEPTAAPPPSRPAPSAADAAPFLAVLRIVHPLRDPFQVPAVLVGEPPRALACLSQLRGFREITVAYPDLTRVTNVAGASEEHDFVLFDLASDGRLTGVAIAPARTPCALELFAYGDDAKPTAAQARLITIDTQGRRAVELAGEVRAPAVAIAAGQAFALVVSRDRALPLDHALPFLARPWTMSVDEFRAQFFARDPAWLLSEGLAAALAGRHALTVERLLAALEARPDLAGRAADALVWSAVIRAREMMPGDPRGAADLLARVAVHAGERPALIVNLIDAFLGIADVRHALGALTQLPTGPERQAAAERIGRAAQREAAALLDRDQVAAALDLLLAVSAELRDQGELLLALARAHAAMGQDSEALRASERAQHLVPGLAAEVAQLRAELTRSDGNTLRIPMHPTSHTIDASLAIQGVNLDCLVDTGASMTSIPTALAEQLGLLRGNPPTVEVNTAGGVVKAAVVQLPTVRLGPFEVRGLKAVVLDLPGTLAGKGLIGLNLLSRFDYQTDTESGALVISRRKGRR